MNKHIICTYTKVLFVKIREIGPEKSDNFFPSWNNVVPRNVDLSSHSHFSSHPTGNAPKQSLWLPRAIPLTHSISLLGQNSHNLKKQCQLIRTNLLNQFSPRNKLVMWYVNPPRRWRKHYSKYACEHTHTHWMDIHSRFRTYLLPHRLRI